MAGDVVTPKGLGTIPLCAGENSCVRRVVLPPAHPLQGTEWDAGELLVWEIER